MAKAKDAPVTDSPFAGLNLTDADDRGFDPFASGTYGAQIEKVTPVTAGDGGKLPEGTPGFNVQFSITDEFDSTGDMEIMNRKVFSRYYVAPEDYPNKKKMDGMLVRFLVATGEDVDEVKGGDYVIPFEDLHGRDVRVRVGKDTDRNQNPVKEVLAPDDGDAGVI